VLRAKDTGQRVTRKGAEAKRGAAKENKKVRFIAGCHPGLLSGGLKERVDAKRTLHYLGGREKW